MNRGFGRQARGEALPRDVTFLTAAAVLRHDAALTTSVSITFSRARGCGRPSELSNKRKRGLTRTTTTLGPSRAAKLSRASAPQTSPNKSLSVCLDYFNLNNILRYCFHGSG